MLTRESVRLHSHVAQSPELTLEQRRVMSSHLRGRGATAWTMHNPRNIDSRISSSNRGKYSIIGSASKQRSYLSSEDINHNRYRTSGTSRDNRNTRHTRGGGSFYATRDNSDAKDEHQFAYHAPGSWYSAYINHKDSPYVHTLPSSDATVLVLPAKLDPSKPLGIGLGYGARAHCVDLDQLEIIGPDDEDSDSEEDFGSDSEASGSSISNQDEFENDPSTSYVNSARSIHSGANLSDVDGGIRKLKGDYLDTRLRQHLEASPSINSRVHFMHEASSCDDKHSQSGQQPRRSENQNPHDENYGTGPGLTSYGLNIPTGSAPDVTASELEDYHTNYLALQAKRGISPAFYTREGHVDSKREDRSQIREHRQHDHEKVGVVVSSLYRHPDGVHVMQAEEAGIRVGDEILRVHTWNVKPHATPQDVRWLLRNARRKCSTSLMIVIRRRVRRFRQLSECSEVTLRLKGIGPFAELAALVSFVTGGAWVGIERRETKINQDVNITTKALQALPMNRLRANSFSQTKNIFRSMTRIYPPRDFSWSTSPPTGSNSPTAAGQQRLLSCVQARHDYPNCPVVFSGTSTQLKLASFILHRHVFIPPEIAAHILSDFLMVRAFLDFLVALEKEHHVRVGLSPFPNPSVIAALNSMDGGTDERGSEGFGHSDRDLQPQRLPRKGDESSPSGDLAEHFGTQWQHLESPQIYGAKLGPYTPVGVNSNHERDAACSARASAQALAHASTPQHVPMTAAEESGSISQTTMPLPPPQEMTGLSVIKEGTPGKPRRRSSSSQSLSRLAAANYHTLHQRDGDEAAYRDREIEMATQPPEGFLQPHFVHTGSHQAEHENGIELDKKTESCKNLRPNRANRVAHNQRTRSTSQESRSTARSEESRSVRGSGIHRRQRNRSWLAAKGSVVDSAAAAVSRGDGGSVRSRARKPRQPSRSPATSTNFAVYQGGFNFTQASPSMQRIRSEDSSRAEGVPQLAALEQAATGEAEMTLRAGSYGMYVAAVPRQSPGVRHDENPKQQQNSSFRETWPLYTAWTPHEIENVKTALARVTEELLKISKTQAGHSDAFNVLAQDR